MKVILLADVKTLGKKGDVVVVEAPNGNFEYKIMDIHRN